MTNQDKKFELQRYRRAKEKMRSAELSLCDVMSIITSIKAVAADSSGGGGGHITDLSDKMVLLEKQRSDLSKSIAEVVDARQYVVDIIKTALDPLEESVLSMKYLNFMTWDEISEEMRLSVRHVQRMHGDALTHIEIEKK